MVVCVVMKLRIEYDETKIHPYQLIEGDEVLDTYASKEKAEDCIRTDIREFKTDIEHLEMLLQDLRSRLSELQRLEQELRNE